MFTNVIDVKGRKYGIQWLSELLRRRGKSTAADRCHAEMGLSAVPSEERVYAARQAALRETRVPKLKLQDPWFGYNLGLWSHED
jgi:hypothetical protein